MRRHHGQRLLFYAIVAAWFWSVYVGAPWFARFVRDSLPTTASDEIKAIPWE